MYRKFILNHKRDNNLSNYVLKYVHIINYIQLSHSGKINNSRSAGKEISLVLYKFKVH
jgi:hypothetical protein